VLLLDVVLGYGAHPDPAGQLAPLVDAALAARPGGLSVVVALCGADGDPQGLAAQAAALRDAGALVTRSSARAARLALAAAGLTQVTGPSSPTPSAGGDGPEAGPSSPSAAAEGDGPGGGPSSPTASAGGDGSEARPGSPPPAAGGPGGRPSSPTAAAGGDGPGGGP
jgi:FdrA protein